MFVYKVLKTMKKVFMFVAVAAMMMTAVACGNTNSKKEKAAEKDAQEQVEEAAEEVKDAVKDAAEAVQEAAQEVSEAVKNN